MDDLKCKVGENYCLEVVEVNPRKPLFDYIIRNNDGKLLNKFVNEKSMLEQSSKTKVGSYLKDLAFKEYNNEYVEKHIRNIMMDLQNKYMAYCVEKEAKEKASIMNLIKPSFDDHKVLNAANSIKKHGLIKYLGDIYKHMFIGDSKNLIKKVCYANSIMRGEFSGIIETVGVKGIGKSYEDKIVFEYSIPEEYVYVRNNITWASLNRKDKDFFNRKIVLLGDYGSEKTIEKAEESFDVYKSLITEGIYNTEKSGDNAYDIVENELKVDSIGVVYQTVLPYAFDSDNEQLKSRTVSFTPPNNDFSKLSEFLVLAEDETTKEYLMFQRGVNYLSDFKEYLKFIVNLNAKVMITPYSSIIRRFCSENDIRDFQQIVSLFESYCLLNIERLHKLDFIDIDNMKYDNYYLPTEDVAMEFFNDLLDYHGLEPYSFKFLELLNECMVPLDEETLHKLENDAMHSVGYERINNLLGYYNNNDGFILKSDDDIDYYLNFDDVIDESSKAHNKIINTLFKYNKFDKGFTKNDSNYFFTISTLKRALIDNNSFKNVRPKIMGVIDNLVEQGFIEICEYKLNNNRNKNVNIYYLTNKFMECDYRNVEFETIYKLNKEYYNRLCHEGLIKYT